MIVVAVLGQVAPVLRRGRMFTCLAKEGQGSAIMTGALLLTDLFVLLGLIAVVSQMLTKTVKWRRALQAHRTPYIAPKNKNSTPLIWFYYRLLD